MYVYSGSQVISEYDPAAAVTAPTKEYIYLGAQILATLDAAHNPTYRHHDHLSGRMYSNNSGTVIGTQDHLPFGEAWYFTGTVDKWKFTTYERDTDTNLDYAINRFDSARLARFMSPDPYRPSADPSSPQSWNRYPYVVNDPVNLNDPTGLWFFDDIVCDWCLPILTVAEWDDMHPDHFFRSFSNFWLPLPTGNGIFAGENSTNWPDPYPIMARIQDILSGNWGRTLGLDLSNCNPICDAIKDAPLPADAQIILGKVGQAGRQITNPCTIGAFYGGSAAIGVAGGGAASVYSEGAIFPEMNAAWDASSYYVSQANRLFNRVRPLQKTIVGFIGNAVGSAVQYLGAKAKAGCDAMAGVNW